MIYIPEAKYRIILKLQTHRAKFFFFLQISCNRFVNDDEYHDILRIFIFVTRNNNDLNRILGRRRSSIRKLHRLQLEAPITKVITLLSNAVIESPETAAQIEEVDTLRSSLL